MTETQIVKVSRTVCPRLEYPAYRIRSYGFTIAYPITKCNNWFFVYFPLISFSKSRSAPPELPYCLIVAQCQKNAFYLQ